MFRKNTQHLQPAIISAASELPEKQRKRLENSWAGTFYKLQLRYALGYDRLGDGDFEIRTLYYFRERLSRYNAEHGINLLEKAFEQVTDKQVTALKVRTGMQRMDSTQIASNIVSASRF